MGGKIDIQIWHRKKVLRLRRLDRLIQSKDFTFVWNNISEIDKELVRLMISKVMIAELKRWLQKQLDLGFELYSIKDLRTLASKYHIRYYSRKTRSELIKALTEKGILDDDIGMPLGKDETTPNCSGRQKESSELVNLEATLKNSSSSV